MFRRFSIYCCRGRSPGQHLKKVKKLEKVRKFPQGAMLVSQGLNFPRSDPGIRSMTSEVSLAF